MSHRERETPGRVREALANDAQRARFDRFMTASRGLGANEVAPIMGQFTSGTVWGGSTKTHMAEAYAQSGTHRSGTVRDGVIAALEKKVAEGTGDIVRQVGLWFLRAVNQQPAGVRSKWRVLAWKGTGEGALGEAITVRQFSSDPDGGDWAAWCQGGRDAARKMLAGVTEAQCSQSVTARARAQVEKTERAEMRARVVALLAARGIKLEDDGSMEIVVPLPDLLKLLEVAKVRPFALLRKGKLCCPACAAKGELSAVEYLQDFAEERTVWGVRDGTIYIADEGEQSSHDPGGDERLGCTSCGLTLAFPPDFEVEYVSEQAWDDGLGELDEEGS